jgi:hypothetical protein
MHMCVLYAPAGNSQKKKLGVGDVVFVYLHNCRTFFFPFVLLY